MNTDLLISIFAFTVLTLLWLGFGIALFLNREFLNRVWRSFRSGNILIQPSPGRSPTRRKLPQANPKIFRRVQL